MWFWTNGDEVIYNCFNYILYSHHRCYVCRFVYVYDLLFHLKVNVYVLKSHLGVDVYVLKSHPKVDIDVLRSYPKVSKNEILVCLKAHSKCLRWYPEVPNLVLSKLFPFKYFS